MIKWLLIIVGIIIAIAVLYVFAAGAALTLGMRSKDMCYYDPEDKKWHPLVSLTEEQRSRITPNSNKLGTRQNSSNRDK